ncbi:MAG: patatin-like phospholipase family protein [Candidatus Omnitrophica bacterium]|nr:patatin-like phospholipase family protein [Candidatus Omnitrophota bacterium]
MDKKYKNAIVLGGGGAKGFAHLGVLTTLEKEGLRPDILCGTSAGSIAGAFYSLYAERINEFENIEETYEFKVLKGMKLDSVDFEGDKEGFFLKTLYTVKKKLLLVRMLRDNALLKKEDVEPVFKNLFRDIAFEQLPVPLIAVAFDIVSGKDVYIKTGKLWKGILASCSIPGLLPPVEYGDMLLIDGGITNRLPVKCAVLAGAKSITAVDVNRFHSSFGELNSVFDIHMRTDALISSRFDLYNSRMADFIVKPDLGDMRWNNFSRYRYAIEKGREAAKADLPGIKKTKGRMYFYRKRVRKFMGSETTDTTSINPEEFIIL